MSPHGRPKGELTAVRQHAGFMVHPHGRPKGDHLRPAELRGAQDPVFDERRAAPGVST